MLFVDGQLRLQVRSAQALLVNQPVIAQHQARTIDHALDTAPGQGLEVLSLGALCLQSLNNRLGNGVIGTGRQAGGHLLDSALIASAPYLPLHQLGFALGDGARLVQRNGFQEPGVFQVGSALDQDPAARSRGQSADHCDGRGNDQSTRTGDH